MIRSEISIDNPLSSFIQVKTNIPVQESELIQVQLAAWRPGRYELQNFAQKIHRFQVTNQNNKPIAYTKITKDRWEIKTEGLTEISISYNFFAQQMDAGGSWIDETQLYVNPVNCMLAVLGREKEAYELKVNIPDNWQIAGGLPIKEGKILAAENYEQLADTPFIASETLKYAGYEVNGIPFHIWIQGDCNPDWSKIIADFTAFTQEQLNLFSDFPVADYHFLNQILPYKHYHGVEHSNSTVIALGPGELLMTPALYRDFIGISSHELFHTWNIKNIRPIEMMPYDYTQENYFRTGYVAEGITTYYGDYLLARAGVYTASEYFEELNKVLSKHFDGYGHENYSVADSSFDLWLDGYKPGIPDRKVSIYHKGALAALILDLEIRRNTNHLRSLDTVMKRLYEEFGKIGIGYSEADYERLVRETHAYGLDKYFEDIIYGTVPIQPYLEKALHYVGCKLVKEKNQIPTAGYLGFETSLKENVMKVNSLAPHSPAAQALSLEDEIIAINGRKVEGNITALLEENNEITITLFRNKKLREVILTAAKNQYYPRYTVRKLPEATLAQKANFYLWLKQVF